MTDREPWVFRWARWVNQWTWSERTTKIVIVVFVAVAYPATIAGGALMSANGFADSPWPGGLGVAIGLPLAWAIARRNI